MSKAYTTSERAADSEVGEKLDRMVSHGHPTCDVCRELDQEERAEEAEYWPEHPTVYVNHSKSVLNEWFAARLCPYHDTPEHQPEEATHYVIAEPERYEEHHMNSAHKYHSKKVVSLTGDF